MATWSIHITSTLPNGGNCFGEGQRFWLSLEARDNLGQNNQVNRSVGSNFVQQTQSNLLTQYVMLRAHWKLIKFSRGGGMEVEVD